jgi:hypothetical protein
MIIRNGKVFIAGVQSISPDCAGYMNFLDHDGTRVFLEVDIIIRLYELFRYQYGIDNPNGDFNEYIKNLVDHK